jgi:inner membrane protein
LGLPSGAIETVNEDASRYLLKAHIKGRNAITQEAIEKTYKVLQPLNQNDLLVKDEDGTAYRVGQSQECQIIVSQIRIERIAPVTTKVTNLVLDDEDLTTAMGNLEQEKTYLSGTLTISDAEDLMLPSHIDRFDSITLQPGSSIAYARLIGASPGEVVRLLGDYYGSGNLVVRVITVSGK